MKNKLGSGGIYIILFLLAIGFLIYSNKIDVDANFKKVFLKENPTENITIIEKNNSEEEIIDNLKICSFNMQIFGKKKSSDNVLMNQYRRLINSCDLIFLEEIRDDSQNSPKKLCNLISEDGYSCEISSRAGRTQSKEQIILAYNNEIEILKFKDYNPDSILDRWERPPIKVIIKSNKTILTLYNAHLKPTDVQMEMYYLQQLVIAENDLTKTIISGDFNADCDYYKRNKETEFDNWWWVLGNLDTTESDSTNCNYDVFIVSEDLNGKIGDFGVDSSITPSMSDHYMIWIEV